MTGRRDKRINRVVRMWFILIVVMISMTSTVYGKEEEVTLEMNTTNLQMGISTELSMTLKNITNAKLIGFDGIDNFEILSSGQSNSTQIINGKSTKVSKVTYSITPKEVGVFKLQASIQMDDDVYTTNILEVTVTEMDESLSGAESDLFLRTVVSDETVYFGEPLVISYELYSMYQIENFGFLDDVIADGFVVERSVEDRFEPNYLKIGDNQYVMYRAEQLVLNATKPGDYTIEPFEFQANLGSGSMFSSSKAKYLQTDEVELKVLQVPEVGQPRGYNGLVGNLTLESSYNQTEVANGDPITLNVTVSGSGNIGSISDIASFGDFQGFTVYETEKDLKESVSGQRYFASKTFELILIPKVSGAVAIDAIEIPYFDTVNEQYLNLTIPEMTVKIGEATVINGDGGNSETQIIGQPLLINQVSYAPSAEEFITLTISKKALFNVIVGLLVLVGISGGAILLYQWHKRNNDPIRLMKREVEKAQDDASLYEILVRVYKNVYEVDLRSATVAQVESTIEDETIQADTKQIMFYMEHDKHYNNQRFEEVKTIALKIIQRIMTF